MILCCKVCGNCFHSDDVDRICDYCSGSTEVLFGNDEISSIDKYELDKLIDVSREKYKVNNELYNAELWESREYKESINVEINKRSMANSHMLTTGYDFAGYDIVSYKGIVSGQVVLGTGFISEFAASFSDFFGTQSNQFSKKLEDAKQAAIQFMIEKSVSLGGNAIVGVSFNHITFSSNNMLGVVVNGTSVIIEKNER